MSLESEFFEGDIEIIRNRLREFSEAVNEVLEFSASLDSLQKLDGRCLVLQHCMEGTLEEFSHLTSGKRLKVEIDKRLADAVLDLSTVENPPRELLQIRQKIENNRNALQDTGRGF